MISLTSALIDKSLKWIKQNGEANYGTVTLSDRYWIDVFGWFEETKAELTLKENTDTCMRDCSSETEIKLHQDGVLIDDVKFLTLQEDESWIEQDIRSYQFYIKTDESEYDVDDFEIQCKEKEVVVEDSISINGTAIKGRTYTEQYDCEDVKVGTHKEKEKLWEEYALGEEVVAGTYNIKLEGKKRQDRTVDWIITSQGKEIDEWAWWSGSWGK